jgi:hypothetical protein
MIETSQQVYFIYIYIYKVFQHLVQWLVVIRMLVQPYICYWERKSGCPGCLTKPYAVCWVQKVDSQLVLMIETPHPLHTHTRSSLYIYNAIQHLLLWQVV